MLAPCTRGVQGMHNGCTRDVHGLTPCASLVHPWYTPCTQRETPASLAPTAGAGCVLAPAGILTHTLTMRANRRNHLGPGGTPELRFGTRLLREHHGGIAGWALRIPGFGLLWMMVLREAPHCSPRINSQQRHAV